MKSGLRAAGKNTGGEVSPRRPLCRRRTDGLQRQLDLRMVLFGVPHVLDGQAQRPVLRNGGRDGREGVEDKRILARKPQNVLHRAVVRQAHRAASLRIGVEHARAHRCREEVFQQLFGAWN